MTRHYRPNLPPLPENMRGLQVVRGYPVPWFVQWRDGVPEFRLASRGKFAIAVEKNLCWVCGKKIKPLAEFAFVIGPMCAINRTSSEPPSHVECAVYSALACPFLARPAMERRTDNLPSDMSAPAGQMIARNPGVAMIWITRSYSRFAATNGVLFRIGEPIKVETYCEGRLATNDEVLASIESGLPLLRGEAEKSGLEGLAELARLKRVAYKVLGL